MRKTPRPIQMPDRRDSREHQGVGMDDAGAGGRGWRSDCGPRQDTRRRQRLVVSPKKRSFASELLPASLRDQGLLDLGEQSVEFDRLGVEFVAAAGQRLLAVAR